MIKYRYHFLVCLFFAHLSMGQTLIKSINYTYKKGNIDSIASIDTSLYVIGKKADTLLEDGKITYVIKKQKLGFEVINPLNSDTLISYTLEIYSDTALGIKTSIDNCKSIHGIFIFNKKINLQHYISQFPYIAHISHYNPYHPIDCKNSSISWSFSPLIIQKYRDVDNALKIEIDSAFQWKNNSRQLINYQLFSLKNNFIISCKGYKKNEPIMVGSILKDSSNQILYSFRDILCNETRKFIYNNRKIQIKEVDGSFYGCCSNSYKNLTSYKYHDHSECITSFYKFNEEDKIELLYRTFSKIY